MVRSCLPRRWERADEIFGGDVTSESVGRLRSDIWRSRLSSTKSNKSSFAAILPFTASGVPHANLTSVTKGKNSIYFELHAFGGNPLMPKAPNIDMQVAITAKVDGGRLDIHAELSGDQFPNVEIMLQDEAYERRMLATSETSGSAHFGPGSLIGSAARSMNAKCKPFLLNADGHFS